MATEPIIYIRGAFPGSPDEMVNARFLADAKRALDPSIEQLVAIADELSSFPGFLDQKTLRGIVGSIIQSDEHARSVSRLILNVSRMFRLSGRTLKDLSEQLDAWQRTDENQKVFSVEELAELQRRLSVILKPFDGIERQAKARRLVGATGLKLKAIELICDLRPVFDEERTSVEGVFPYTILKVVCDGEDGLPISMEAILSERDVDELAKKAEAATIKLRSLKALLAAKDIRIPAVWMTEKEGD
jgi:hypothetical protein